MRSEGGAELPPGQVESEAFPRFGWGKLAFRFPENTKDVQIAIRGDVAAPLVVRDELVALPRVEQISDFHCVTTWSKRGLRWSGFRFRDFYRAIVEPKAAPQPDANLVHGAPIRLVAPAHYGYKNSKHVCAIEFWRDAHAYRFIGPKFMDHPRARVALEERGRGVPAWILRRVYPTLVPPIRWLFRVALARPERRRLEKLT